MKPRVKCYTRGDTSWFSFPQTGGVRRMDADDLYESWDELYLWGHVPYIGY